MRSLKIYENCCAVLFPCLMMPRVYSEMVATRPHPGQPRNFTEESSKCESDWLEHRVFMNTEDIIRIVILGAKDVGKSSLLRSLMQNDESFESYFGMINIPTKQFDLGNTCVSVNIFEASGMQSIPTPFMLSEHTYYEKLRPLSYPNTHIFIFSFAFNSRDTLDYVERTVC